jgi:hypothetical protein
MRKALVLVICVLVVGLILAHMVGQSLRVLQLVARVDSIEGSAYVQRPGDAEPAPLEAGDLIYAGANVTTGEDSAVVLTWANGSKMWLSPSSRLVIKKSELNTKTRSYASLFSLKQGEAWCRTADLDSPDSFFQVETPSATAGVRGTIFRVRVSPDKTTSIYVSEGEVLLGENDGTSTVVTAGKEVVLPGTPGATPTEWREVGSTASPPDAIVEPYLSVKWPRTPLAPGSLTLRGRAEPGTEVTVNGITAERRREHFEVEINVPAGSALPLEVVATDSAGRTAVEGRELEVE